MADEDLGGQKVFIGYDKKDLKAITRSFKGMSDEAIDQAKTESAALAQFLGERIVQASHGAPFPKVATRIAQGFRVKKSSKIGELSFGFASQRFSGGATTEFNFGTQGGNGLLAGAEFGAKKYPNFPPRTPRYGVRGNEGYFIYPTLRANQEELVRKWETAFNRILKEWA
jgi:hypothetical protein